MFRTAMPVCASSIFDFGDAMADAGHAVVIDDDGKAVIAGTSNGLFGIVRVLGDDVTSTVVEPFGSGDLRLGRPWPNPTKRGTSMVLHSAVADRVTVGVFDVRGRLERSLVLADPAPSGSRTLTWYGNDTAGDRVPNGVYWIRAQRGADARARRVTVVH